MVGEKDPGNGESWYYWTNGIAVVTQNKVCKNEEWRVEDGSCVLSY